MSFGYSVGDVIAGANLSYRLLRVMADSKGASAEYQEAILELGVMQQAFMQVSQMKRNVIPEATVNAATHIVMSSIDLIAKFLDRTKKYQQRLLDPRGFGIQSSLCQVGWSLYTSHELQALRDGLHSKLSSEYILLSAAS
ncbi:hypothetical protein B0H66DRAFT_194806 [Apodospora peruviana]|uniref:Uncharacterized protein n=1 Tax=Apodospora peruviana TaxID=516989 RepID=A0AAE0IBQ3_9PEZI|nr:hypothetical protein B0H66DRAFT_194806 [Apodospora peruviana]